MAKYTIEHKCGHNQDVQIYGKEKNRPERAEWLAGQSCPDCKREQARLDIEAWTGARGLVALEGSPKQVSWALKIRKGLLEEMDKYIDPSDGSDDMKHIIRAYQLISKQAQAKWWIDHRSETGKSLLLKMLRQQETVVDEKQ